MQIQRRFNTIVFVSIMLWAAAAQALINPRFTPVNLVNESALIVSVDLRQGASKDQYDAVVREVLKGKTELKAIHLDLSKARDEQNADSFRKLAAAGAPALFFMGEFSEQGGGAPQLAGLLSVSGRWASCVGTPDGKWLFDNIEGKYQAVWAGGTDMLRRCVDYVLTENDPGVPTADGVAWSIPPVKIATLEGTIAAVRPIDLAGDGNLQLFVACDKGDRLLACDAKSRAVTDIASTRGLQSKSQAFAWGNFNGQGRLDLISFDGKALSLQAQQPDGTFKARPLEVAGALANGCVGLAALDGGVKGRSSLLVSAGTSWPLLVSLTEDGKPSLSVLAVAGVDLQTLGRAGACLVADFDGDGIADILAPGEAGSVWFRGQAPGKFAPGIACAVKLGKGPSSACLGDFDADGRLDILGVHADGIALWQNEGGGKFSESLGASGEIAYIGRTGGSDCIVGDINNDGHQDALIAYRSGCPHIFFNRGFRCFGHAHTLDLSEQNVLPEAEQGQQSGCLADFDGDGAQDMALALRTGEIWMFYRANEDGDARLATASLQPGGEYEGPVTVTGWIGKKCLGAWNVLPGVGQACFGRREAGPVTLKWRLPDGKDRQKGVILVKSTVKANLK
jgi:hypothetical protein